ncbi:hypothetical protein FQN60_014872, partial [Etheostoma spectabile]
MPETTQETCASAKDSPFFIKNLLNCDSKPSKPKPVLASTKAALEGGFSLSHVGDFNFPRFDLPAQRFSLPAHYLERTSAWWYPYALSSSVHLHRTEVTDKLRARDSSPTSGTDRDSPDLVLKSEPDVKDEDEDDEHNNTKSGDEIILEESDTEEVKKDELGEWKKSDDDKKPCRKKKTRTVFSRSQVFQLEIVRVPILYHENSASESGGAGANVPVSQPLLTFPHPGVYYSHPIVTSVPLLRP